MRRILYLVLVVTVSGCGSLSSPLDWFGDPEPANPPSKLVDFEQSYKARTLWSTDIGSGSDEFRLSLVPVAYRGRIYAANRSGDVRALEASSGKTVWEAETDLPVSAGPGVGDGLVVLGTVDAEIIALNEEDGKERWRAQVSSEVLSVPKVKDGTVVVRSIDGQVAGYLAATGDRLWLYNRPEPVLTLRGVSSPVVSGSSVLIGFSDGKLVSLRLTDGKPLWEVSVTEPRGRSEIERMVDIDADPVVMGGIIYVSTYQGDLAAITEDTGVVLWRRELSSYAGLGVDFRQVYVTDANDSVWGVDPGNGAALWKQDKLSYRKLTAPAVTGDQLVVGDLEGYLHWLSSDDGKMLARTRVGRSPIAVKPIVDGDTVYAYCEGGELAAVTLAPPTGR